MAAKDALLALPGPSTTSLVLNIPHLSRVYDQPVVLMDVHDYNKIRSRAILEDKTKYHYLTLAYEEFVRKGVIELIDYSEFYPPELRQRNIERNDELLQNLATDISQRYATVACELWTDYARGEYQERFRSGLTEDVSEFRAMRRSERRQEKKMASGVGDSTGWLRKVLNKDMAALHIRRNADRELDGYNILGVVAGGEHLVTSRLSGGSPSSLSDYSLPGSTAGSTAGYLERLEAADRIEGMMPTGLAETRETLNLTSELAREVTEVEDDDWFVLGPSIAVPSYDDLFDMDVVQYQFRDRSLDEIQNQAVAVAETLQSGGDLQTSANKLEYLGEYTAEQTAESVVTPRDQRKSGFSIGTLTASIERAMQLSATSDQIRSLTKEKGYDQAAVLVALSFLNDPAHRYEQQDVFRKATQLKRQLNPPTFDRSELSSYEKERQGETWADNKDWHEDPEADR